MAGTLLLDSEGLSKLYRKERTVMALVQAASEEGVRVATSAMTTLEADYERIHPARIKWVLSRIDIRDITKDITGQAAALLRSHHLHGHTYAIDAACAAIARISPQPVTVLASDPENLMLLCGPAAEQRQGVNRSAHAEPRCLCAGSQGSSADSHRAWPSARPRSHLAQPAVACWCGAQRGGTRDRQA